MLERWGAFVARRALCGAAGRRRPLVLAAGAYGVGVFDSLSQGGFDDPDSEASRELALERDTFGNRGVDVVAIYSSDELTADSPEFRAAVEDAVADIPDGTTSSVVTYYDTRAPTWSARTGTRVQVQISLEGDSQDELPRQLGRGRADPRGRRARDRPGRRRSRSTATSTRSPPRTSRRAEEISLPIVILLALLIFGSLVAAAMPALVGLLAVVGSLAVVRLITGFTEVSIFSVNVITLLGMGLAIDYALFMISRFREELAQLPDDDPDASAKAIVRTMTTAGRTVLFSGLTVAAAMSSLLVFPQAFLKQHGVRRHRGRR